jgi:tetraacyldisaccharide 4'-kinase
MIRLRRLLELLLKVPTVPVLAFAMLPYFVYIWVRNKLYDIKFYPEVKLPVAVISIGNVSTGGTGKTPMAEFLLRWSQQSDYKLAYLSRGYRRETSGFVLVKPFELHANDVGDEALQVATRYPQLPVAVCEDRVEGIKQLLELYPDLQGVILDDAFQHRRVHRDLDIVMLDCTRPAWKDNLLPLGRLREPFRNIKRADLLVFNRLDNPKKIGYYRQKAKGVRSVFAKTEPIALRPFNPLHPVINIDNTRGRACIAFSGIGNNEQFAESLRNVGLHVYHSRKYADHYNYQLQSIRRLIRQYKLIIRKKDVLFLHSPVIVTTEKDYTRLKNMPWITDFAEFPLYYVEIALTIVEGNERLDNSLRTAINKHIS